MDVKEQISKAVEKIMSDKKLQEQFMKDPEKAIESVIGMDIPDGIADQIIKAVKAKMAGDKLTSGIDLIKKLI